MRPGPVIRGEKLVVERETELAEIDAALEALTAGSGSAVVLVGNAGVGKTRLVEVAVERAATAGVEILTARGNEIEQEFSFGVVLQLLQRRVLTVAPWERAELLSGAAALAGPLLEGTQLQAAAGPEAAFGTHHGLYWLVANLAERRPLLLAVDDAHWADPSSLRFLASLCHRLEGLAVMVLLVRRLGEASSSDGLLDAIAGSRTASAIRLRPLTDDAIATLVRARYDQAADDAFCEACARAVNGNPLYLRELLGVLRSEGVSADNEGSWRIPDVDLEALGRSVRARLSRLGDDASAFAEATSVIDGDLPLRLVAQVAELEADAAGRATRALAVADILTEEDPVRFVHPLVRHAIYSGLDVRRREALHRRAAEILRDARADSERIAGHLQLSERRGEEWAAQTLLVAAATATERGAPATAVTYLRRALSEDPPDELRPTILGILGLAGLASGEAQALEFVRQAAAAARTGGDRARYYVLASETLFYVRRFSDALEMVRLAMAEVDQGVEEDLAGYVVAVAAGLSSVTLLADPDSVRRLPEFCERITARGIAPQTPAERLVLGVRAGLITFSGDLPAERARGLARLSLSTAPGEEIKAAMFQPAMALSYTDDYDESEAALAGSIEAARRRGFIHDFTMASCMRSDPFYRSGKIAEAMADAEAALEGARQGIDGFEPPTRAVLGRCLLDRGDLEGAERLTDLPDRERWSGITHLALLDEARGHVLLAQGRSREARDAFRSAGEISRAAGALNPSFCAWRSGMALAEHALGKDDEAKRVATEEVELANAFGARRAIGIALRVKGLVEGGVKGAALLDEAVSVLAGSQAGLEHARALLDRGAAHRRAGRVREARNDLREALDRAQACGAYGLAARAREELVAAGGRPRRERLSGAASLTPQEHRIARMVVDGLSNREIAEALFLTRKTIENHLTNVYAKLGIARREELAPILSAAARGE